MHDEFAALNDLRLSEFRVEDYFAGEEALLVVASQDLSYYIDAEIRFTEVDYLSLPTYFCDAIVRAATDAEVADLRRLTEWESGKRVFCVVTDAGWTAGERRHFVVAGAVSLRLERQLVGAGR
jgi:hypothetical protein